MMNPLGHYHAHENPGGVEIVEMRLGGDPLNPLAAPQGALDRGWIASPDLRTTYGVPVDATAVTIQLKAKAVCPTWSGDNCVAMIGAALRKFGSTEQTAHSVYAESWKPAGQANITPRTISYNTVTVGIGSVNGKFEAHVEQNIVNHAELELNFSIVGYWHAGT